VSLLNPGDKPHLLEEVGAILRAFPLAVYFWGSLCLNAETISRRPNHGWTTVEADGFSDSLITG